MSNQDPRAQDDCGPHSTQPTTTDASETAPRPTPDLDIDAAMAVVGAARRRTILRVLFRARERDADGVAFGELCERVAEADGVGGEAVTLDLIHKHLPLLVDHGVVSDTDRVRPGPNFDRAVSALNAVVLAVDHDAAIEDGGEAA